MTLLFNQNHEETVNLPIFVAIYFHVLLLDCYFKALIFRICISSLSIK